MTSTMGTRKAVLPDRPHALCRQHGYTPAVQSGDPQFVSRMVGARADGTPEPDLGAQVRLAFDNLRAVLDKAGCGFDDVIAVTRFLVDPDASAGPALEAVAKAFPRVPKSNVTAVGVTRLAGFQFEVKVIARTPQK